MAENTRVLVSPGVLTRQIDGTFRPADPVGQATAIVSRREKGPAMIPTLVKDKDVDEQLFGKPSRKGDDYGAYCARALLDQQVRPTMQVRLLGLEDTGVVPGYSVGGTYAIVASGSSVVALIQASGAVALEGTLSSSAEELAISIAGYGAVTASLHRNSDRYLTKVLNTDSSQYDTQKHMLFSVYDYVNKSTSENTYGIAQVDPASDWTDQFITGATTTVISQPFDSVEWDLFGIRNRFAGDSANEEFKVSILRIKKSPNEDFDPFGSFSLIVRSFDDNDRAPQVLESFSGLSLDPDSPNYICRRIGDMYEVWNKTDKKFDEFGEYENKSKYISIDPSLDLKNGNVPDTALPWGYKGYRGIADGAVSGLGSFPDLPTVQTLEYGSDFNTSVYWGVEVVNNFSASLNHGLVDRLKHLPAALRAASGSVGANFSLKWVSGSVDNLSSFATTTRLADTDLTALSTSLSFSANAEASPVLSGASGFTGYLSVDNLENTDLAKFTMVMNDGFDGVDITLSNPFDPENMVSTSQYQTHAYRTALDMLSDGDRYEISELVMPGVWADKVVDYGIEMVEGRGDTFYLADVSGSSKSDAIDFLAAKTWDSSYAAVWYSWQRHDDDVFNKQVEVPPTVHMPAAFAYNDTVAARWWAPAGLNRGGLSIHGAIRAKDRLKKRERDDLYDNRINPIRSFGQEGPVAWGQKTLQRAASALDRINVQRMLLSARKIISKKALYIVFEPNVAAVWDRFKDDIRPDLERIQRNFGIEDFKLVLDERTTTEDLIERNIMYGKIAVKPTRTSEYVLLDFFVTNDAAGFEV